MRKMGATCSTCTLLHHNRHTQRPARPRCQTPQQLLKPSSRNPSQSQRCLCNHALSPSWSVAATVAALNTKPWPLASLAWPPPTSTLTRSLTPTPRRAPSGICTTMALATPLQESSRALTSSSARSHVVIIWDGAIRARHTSLGTGGWPFARCCCSIDINRPPRPLQLHFTPSRRGMQTGAARRRG